MKKLFQNTGKFVLGAFLYCGIELVWRGKTHFTMAILGGVIYVLLSYIDTTFFDAPLIVKSVLGSGLITALELPVGIILNMKLKLKVWNYTGMPYNILGQICPKYTFFWFLLCVIAFVLLRLKIIIKERSVLQK